MAGRTVEIVLDVETTGLDYTKEKMVEFGAVKLVNGVIKETFETLINPEQHIRKSSIAVHGITEDDVKDAPVEKDIMPKIAEFIGDYPIVAHNAIFDASFLNEASKRVFGKEITNPIVDSQAMFKEVYPDLESCGLSALTAKFNVELPVHHRALADAVGLAKAYPALKKLFKKKYAWQSKQIANVEYLFERFLRIQSAVSVMQAELQDLKSVFRLYFEQGGKPISSCTGEKLVFQHKQSFNYKLSEIKELLDELGVLEKAVRVNNGFIDRFVNSKGIDEETREKIQNARYEISETKNIQIVKSDKR